MARQLVFLINLVQDVAACRPIVEFAAREFDGEIAFMVTEAFGKRDASGLWTQEISEISATYGAEVVSVGNVMDAARFLCGRGGLVIALSETNLVAHQICNDIFRATPASFLTVTFQHGFECPGFIHNPAHDRAHGMRIGFAADVIVGWFDADYLYSVKPSERSKLFVAGPPLLLSPRINWPPSDPDPSPGDRPVAGLVCENLHSVRFRHEEGARLSFIDTFGEFAAKFAGTGGRIELRPHPAGRFMERNGVELPLSVVRNTAPLYKQDLGAFRFGISAPSSVLIDMILAGIPTAVWQSSDDAIDVSNYAGLTVVRESADWLAFAEQALNDPKPILARQRAFIDDLDIPQDVPARYRALLSAGA